MQAESQREAENLGFSSARVLPTLLCSVTAHLPADILPVCCYTLASSRAPVALWPPLIQEADAR